MAVKSFKITIHDYSPQVLAALKQKIKAALERCGQQAEGYATDLVPVDTGLLRQSITHRYEESEQAVYVGSNSEYAAYVELGTGKYYPGGRKQPWVYQDAKGQWHRTEGNRPKPYLKPALMDHIGTYKNIIEDELRG